jgi:hypothetical protein
MGQVTCIQLVAGLSPPPTRVRAPAAALLYSPHHDVGHELAHARLVPPLVQRRRVVAVHVAFESKL